MARFGNDRFGGYYPPSKPIVVDGGIATSKQRGPMAGSWWSKRFTDVLESFGLGGRMARGRRSLASAGLAWPLARRCARATPR